MKLPPWRTKSQRQHAFVPKLLGLALLRLLRMVAVGRSETIFTLGIGIFHSAADDAIQSLAGCILLGLGSGVMSCVCVFMWWALS